MSRSWPSSSDLFNPLLSLVTHYSLNSSSISNRDQVTSFNIDYYFCLQCHFSFVAVRVLALLSFSKMNISDFSLLRHAM